MKPKVSIIIPAYGGSDSLRLTIDSVLAQTYDNIEIIVVDSESADDDTAKSIVNAYGSKINFYKEAGSSTSTALNFGIKKLTGKYFSWLSPGDTYHTSRVEKLVALVEGESSTIAVSGWAIINRNGRKIQSGIVDSRLEKYPSCFLAFARETYLNSCSIMIPARMLKNNELFDGSLPPSQDYKMLNRLIMTGASFKVVNIPLLRYSPHNERESSVEPKGEYDYDFIFSEVISTLNYDDIVGYFGSKDEAVTHYKEILDARLPRSASFLMEKIIKGSIDANEPNDTKRLLLDDLSGLTESQMATTADVLISRVTRPSGKRKILFCSAHWLTGGMERVMAVLFRELQNDYEMFLITPYDERKSHIDVPDFVTSIKISNALFMGHFDSLILSYALLLDIDIVVGFINLFEKQLNLYNLCAGTKIITIASNHEYYFYPYKSPTHYEIVEKRLSAYVKCDALVWPNNFNAALCGMYVENSYVIGNPNNFEVVRGVNPKKENVIICVGRFNDYVKRIDRILECFAQVLKKVPDAKLILVGKYDKDLPISQNDNTSINDLLRILAIPYDSINFVGEVNNVHDYYAVAKVLILTSNSEGFGMVLNEAACFGVPSVCNYIPGIEDIINDGENGYITKQGDISSMASKVINIFNDDALQKKLGVNAREKVKSYDASHIGDKWRYLINSLLETKNKDVLHEKLKSKLGYNMQDQKLFSRVLSRELNEIFYMSIKVRGKDGINNKTHLILNKVAKLPDRLMANIKYEGLPKTITKAITRSFRIVLSKLKA